MPRLRWSVLVGLLLAAACLGPSAYDFARAFRMAAWPSASGRVVQSDVRMVEAGARYRYFTDIEVEYAVDGAIRRTRSLRADSALSSFDRAWADRVVNSYQKGNRVDVRYRPEDPSQTRVEIWPEPVVWVLAIWGLCALFAALWHWKRAAPTPAAGPGGTAA